MKCECCDRSRCAWVDCEREEGLAEVPITVGPISAGGMVFGAMRHTVALCVTHVRKVQPRASRYVRAGAPD